LKGGGFLLPLFLRNKKTIMIKFADVIVDLQAGDTGKGKVAHALSRSKEYTHVVRYNGGGNAGHTIYHNGQKFVTHYIPCGVIHGIKSIIGPGCVVNVSKLFEEIQTLRDGGVDVDDKIFIDKRVHLITDDHVEEDSKDTVIGTTKTGNGPCYRDKYYRKGLRAGEVDFLKPMVIDLYEEFHGQEDVSILFEGAQGFELDIDWGDYPYVTSSHCTVGSAVLNGVPPQKIRDVIGIAKAYRTYVGSKMFEPESDIFDTIREVGGEYGATTGRKRQVNWIDMDDMIKAANINGVTKLIVNKIDVLEQVGEFRSIFGGVETSHTDRSEMQTYINQNITKFCPTVQSITFSVSPFDI
jgi:adenylosuccinate synthase